MHFSEVGFQILRAKREIPSAVGAKFWKNSILKAKKVKLWSFIENVMGFQFFEY